jgi:acetolactate synthase-1/2/3 large subunit
VPTVADLIVDGLIRAQVPRLFGTRATGWNHPVLEAARARGLPVVLCRPEWVACTMAAVTGELTGRPGAVLSTLGPGVTASATGLAHAYLDRAPLIFLSDRHPLAMLELATRQSLDHAAHLEPIVKGSVTATSESAGHWIAHAVRLALGEPRGPVHLQLAADSAARPAVPVASGIAPAPPPMPDAALVEQAAVMIRAARHPLVIAGIGCRGADTKWLRAFSEALPAPVLTTCKAKGAIPDPHPLALGVFTGGTLEAPLMRLADLIIAFGLDPVELMPQRWSYSTPVLSLARCPSSDPYLHAAGGGSFTPALEVIGEPGVILEDLAPRLIPAGTRADWDVAQLDRIRRERTTALAVPTAGLAPHRVAQLARELTAAGTIASVDPGPHIFPTAAYWHALEPGELLVSNGLGMTGFALPAAIAARLVHADRRVVCFTNRDGLLRAATELETVARLHLPILIIVFDDELLAPSDVGAESRDPGLDLAALGGVFGLRTFVATDEATLQDALVTAQTVPGPALVAARVDPSGYPRILQIVGAAAG